MGAATTRPLVLAGSAGPSGTFCRRPWCGGMRLVARLGDDDLGSEASKHGVELWADNPIELLGLVGVWEARWPGQRAAWSWTRGKNAAYSLEVPRSALRRFLGEPRLADLRDTPDDPSGFR